MMKRLLALVPFVLLICSATAFSQVAPDVEQGIHPFGSYEATKVGMVNLQNGAVEVKIPLFSYPERGKFDATVYLMMSSKQWGVNLTCDTYTGACSGDWEVIDNTSSGPGTNNLYPNLLGMDIGIDGGRPTLGSECDYVEMDNGRWHCDYRDVAVDLDGGIHQIMGGTDTSPQGATIDGTGMILNPWTSSSSPEYLLTRDGVSSTDSTTSPQYLQIEDPNGNFEMSTAVGSAGTDSIGRPGVYSAIKNAQTLDVNTAGTTDGCTGPLPIAGVKLLTFPGLNGTNRLVKLCSVYIAGQTNFQVNLDDPGNPGDGTPITEGSYAGYLLQSAVLYNGTDWTTSPAWTFQYSGPNSDGSNYLNLTQIEFPTGGTISYTWNTITSNGVCGYAHVSEYIIQRTVNANDGSPAEVYTYQYNQPGTIVTDAENNVTKHYFSSVTNDGTCNVYETETDYYQGSTTLLKKVQTTYTGELYPFYPEIVTNMDVNVFPASVTTTLANGMVKKVTTQYDSSLSVQYWDPYYYEVNTGQYGELVGVSGLSRGLLLKKQEYGFGQGAPGPLVRCTQYSYLALQNSQYMNENLIDLPSQVSVYAGACGGTLASQTNYAYDGASLEGSGVTTQHASSPLDGSARGNLTSLTKWLNTGGVVTTSTSYYDTGMPYQATDGDGYTTTYSYSSAYAGGLLTETQMPDTGSPAVHHIVQAGYDFNTGLMTSYTDQNSQVTTFSYDGLNRMTQIKYPTITAGQPTTTLSYPNFNTVIESVLDGKTTTTEFDGLGRKSHVIVTDPEGNDTTDYTYDSDGLLASVSNPYRSTSDPTYGVTSFTYNALGQKLTQTQPSDTGTLNWTPDGNVTTYYDENGNQWQRTTDAFGNLVKVVEPNPTTGTLDYETDYTYDTLNHLTRVDQWGGPSGSGGDRVRSFQYDSIGRLLSATNPETGTVTYHYDNNGNATSKTDANGATTSYTYDQLNRMLTKQAPGISYTYLYDVASTPYGFTSQYPIGHLVEESNAVNASTQYGYDQMGNIAYEANCVPSNCTQTGNAVSAVYDLDGHVTSLTYPDGRVVKSTYLDGWLQTVNYDNWNGQSVNYPYLSSATYEPNGAVHSMTYGNGAIEVDTHNSRLQPHESALQTDAGGVLENVWDKWYCYGPSDPQCPSLGANRGDIQRVLDLHTNNNSQGFSYDTLNRLIAFNTGPSTFVQNFGYDPWGNMTQTGTQSFQVNYGTNNRIAASGFTYDADGNLTETDIGVAETYAYDALGQLTNYDSGGATYTYDAIGQRVREDSAGAWTEYIYWKGTPLTELNSDGTWSDYIFANGKRIARADSYDDRIHTQGTSTVAGSYAAWYLPFSGYVIQSGDRIHWRQYQSAAKGGIGISFTDSTNTDWSTHDTDGQVMNSDSTEGTWHQRTVDLTPFAGKTVDKLWITADSGTPVGNWVILYGDISIVHPDGTVTTIYDRGKSESFSYWSGGGETSPQAWIEHKTTSGNQPAVTTSYYLADQIGSTRMVLSAGGWPVAGGTYYPFGVEIGSSASPNHYKFSGKDRDAASGLDDFGARYYSSVMGRFMTPDWSASPEPVPYAKLDNPQSLNLYSYVENNPLTGIDADGHCPTKNDNGTVADAYSPSLITQAKPACPESIGINVTEGQVAPKGAVQNQSSAPSRFVIAGSKNMGSFSLFTYQLETAKGMPLTGNGYAAEEHITGNFSMKTSNHQFVPLDNGKVTDTVGWANWIKGVPHNMSFPAGTNIDAKSTQTFTIRYGKRYYNLTTRFEHEDRVVNGKITNTVTVIVP